MKYLNKFLVLCTVLAVPLFATAVSAEEKPDSPLTVEGATTVDATAAKALFDGGALFVDVRKDSDWNAGRIPGALHLELKSNFTDEALSQEADKADKVVLYCNGAKCLRSSKASKMAVEWGYTDIYYFRLGFPSWKEAGNPVE